MSVTSATNVSNTSTSSSNGAKSISAFAADSSTFLKLLVTELQNQDPTSPMDTSSYMNQLASMSSVEQAVQTNQKLDQLLTTSSLQQADQVIGRTVTSADGSQSGTVVAVNLSTSGPVAQLTDGSTLALGSGITIS